MWRLLWILWVLLVVLVTTIPWSEFQGHSHWDMVRWIPFEDAALTRRSFFDIVTNVLLFVPFGYCYVRFQPRVDRGTFLRLILLAATLSGGGELFQVFCHNRIPSMTDISTNIIGAAIGSVIVMSGQWLKK